MSVQVPTAAQLAVGSFNATSTSNMVDWGVDVAVRDKTTWGSRKFQEFAPTTRTLRVALGGFNDYAAAAWDEYARTNAGSAQIVTLAYADSTTAGTGAIMANGLMPQGPSFNASVSDLPTIAPTIVGSTIYPPVAEGQVTQTTGTAITATVNTTPVQLGQLAATQYIVAAIHIFDYSGTGTLTFQIQSSSSSGGSYTNRGSAGTALSAAGAQWLSATSITTTNTWWRLNVTASASPSATVLASLAIFTP